MLLQILVQEGCFFLLGQALQAEDSGDWPANRHVGGPVGAKDHTVDADRVDQHAQGGLIMGRTIVAMSLSRLWQQQGKRAEAYEILASIYGWCTEGFDTADLKETKALLEELEG